MPAAASHWAGASQPNDRVFVHDLVLDTEIGVYHNERGVTQRVRFSVDIELKAASLDAEDMIERVLDYDFIINGVKAVIARRRFNLTETLAEEIAQHCLEHPRTAAVRVRVEKLDKEPGSVGVEIVRIGAPA